MPFASLGLSPALVHAAAQAGFVAPTPIQAGAIPAILQGVDPVSYTHLTLPTTPYV